MDDSDDIVRMVDLIDLCDDDESSALRAFIEIDEDDDADVEFLGEVTREATAGPHDTIGVTLVGSVTIHGQALRPGGTVELVDGDFLRVTKLSIDRQGQTQLHGYLLRRTKHFTGMLDQKVNELCVVTQSTFSDRDIALADCTVTRPAEEAVDVRDCVFTNQPFPALTWRDHLPQDLRREDWRVVKKLASEQMLLTCRWRSTAEVEGNQILSESLTRLSEGDADSKASCSDVMLWRKYLEKGSNSGCSTPSKRKHDPATGTSSAGKPRTHADHTLAINATTITIDDESVDSEPEIVFIKRKSATSEASRSPAMNDHTASIPALATQAPQPSYTYGDICTGAGGMASGAVQAGLRMQFGLDHDHDACETLRLNFNTRVLEEDVHAFCTKLRTRGYLRVDVLHISFPCKFYSPAHTIAGKDDEMNVATGYAVKPILERCRPRVVTFEQTFGMLFERNAVHFHALIRQLTDSKYSVRWKLVNLADFGNPHARKRLIIIASCPGEPLPRFPEPTHGAGPGKKPYTTIHQVLSRIDYPNVPAYMQQYSQKRGAEYDPHQPLKQAITCSGGLGNLHPSGSRSFMPIELAALQTFRHCHQFYGTYTSVKTQIGNAVPPVFGKTLFRDVVKSMRKHDRTVEAYTPPMIELD